MTVLGSSQPQTGCVLENGLSLIQFFHFRAFYQITGHSDHIAVAGIEGQIAQIHFKGPLNDIQHIFRVAVHRHIDWENISGSGGKIPVEMLKHL